MTAVCNRGCGTLAQGETAKAHSKVCPVFNRVLCVYCDGRFNQIKLVEKHASLDHGWQTSWGLPFHQDTRLAAEIVKNPQAVPGYSRLDLPEEETADGQREDAGTTGVDTEADKREKALESSSESDGEECKMALLRQENKYLKRENENLQQQLTAVSNNLAEANCQLHHLRKVNDYFMKGPVTLAPTPTSSGTAVIASTTPIAPPGLTTTARNLLPPTGGHRDDIEDRVSLGLNEELNSTLEDGECPSTNFTVKTSTPAKGQDKAAASGLGQRIPIRSQPKAAEVTFKSPLSDLYEEAGDTHQNSRAHDTRASGQQDRGRSTRVDSNDASTSRQRSRSRRRPGSPRERESTPERREPSPRRRDSPPRRRESPPCRRDPSPRRRASPMRYREPSPRRPRLSRATSDALASIDPAALDRFVRDQQRRR